MTVHKSSPKAPVTATPGAKHGHHSIEARVGYQHKRIEQGLKNGWITDAQAAALTKGVDEVGAKLKAAKAAAPNHKLSATQLADFTKQFDGLSGHIFQQKQTGRVEALAKSGKITAEQATTLTGEIDQSAKGIEKSGKELGNDWKSLTADIHRYEGNQKSKLSLPPMPTTPAVPAATPTTTAAPAASAAPAATAAPAPAPAPAPAATETPTVTVTPPATPAPTPAAV